MSSNLRVNNILPSVGNNVAIGTAGGSVTLTGSVTGDITSSGVSTFTTLSATNIVGVSTLGVTTAYINTLSGISTIDASAAISINQNLVFASGKGIDFSATANSSGTTTSELLDDYEEGEWSPTLIYDVAGTSSFTYNSSQTVGRYIKIGRLVYVKFKIVLTAFSKGTASGDLYITGLPFTVETGTTGESVSTIFYYDAPFDNTKHQQWLANPNSTDIRLKEVGNNATHVAHTDPDSTSQYGGCLTYTT